jgi:hypothetical protein
MGRLGEHEICPCGHVLTVHWERESSDLLWCSAPRCTCVVKPETSNARKPPRPEREHPSPLPPSTAHQGSKNSERYPLYPMTISWGREQRTAKP